jgi:prolyl-tRNA synthetase
LLINQWANVYRWEMRTRLFLRTAEFLWQEGHTAHATAEEAVEETIKMLHVYKDFAENYMAMPVIHGLKSEGQKFPGAVNTYCIEAMMQDKKALQAGTSHFLGQNFAKAFDVQFQTDKNDLDYVWATSWGVSTRLVGAIIMSHADDDGVIIPPKLAQWPVVILPIYRKDDERSKVMPAVDKLIQGLKDHSVGYRLDDRNNVTPGFRFAEAEMFGYALRVELGPRDLAEGKCIVTLRHNREKISVPLEHAAQQIPLLLDRVQNELLEASRKRLVENTQEINSYDEFKEYVAADSGFASVHWAGDTADEKRIQEETKATLRVIPMDVLKEEGRCMLTGKPSKQRVIFSKAY